jgi:hypothetical protein
MVEATSVLAAILAVAGSLLLAVKHSTSKWAWLLWVASNVLWIGWAWHEKQWALLGQQLVFMATSLLGTWQWLVRPYLLRRGTRSSQVALGQPALEQVHR